jgi:hypothetical protein
MKKLLPLLLLSLTLLLVAGTEPPFRPPPDKPAGPPPAALEKYHAAHVVAFAESPGFGASRTMQPPMWEPGLLSVVLPATETPHGSFRREQFNLVSLLDHDPAVVYTASPTSHDSVRRGTAAMPTRKPDAFELEALVKLKAGQALVVGPADDGGFRMLGALWAQKNCVECHEDRREGDLLGAFSYRLVAAVAPQPKVESAPSSRKPPRP